jgi:hypothetical protein
MKIGFICPNLPGHINPLTALARHLQSRNHEVVFLYSPSANGLPCVPGDKNGCQVTFHSAGDALERGAVSGSDHVLVYGSEKEDWIQTMVAAGFGVTFEAFHYTEKAWRAQGI